MMKQVSLQVPEVHCDHCKTSIEGAVSLLSGISNVDVAIADASVAVEYDENAIDLGQIKEAIEEQGYAVFG
jgi:copper chaperone